MEGTGDVESRPSLDGDMVVTAGRNVTVGGEERAWLKVSTDLEDGCGQNSGRQRTSGTWERRATGDWRLAAGDIGVWHMRRQRDPCSSAVRLTGSDRRHYHTPVTSYVSGQVYTPATRPGEQVWRTISPCINFLESVWDNIVS